jgi:hypothetical protein
MKKNLLKIQKSEQSVLTLMLILRPVLAIIAPRFE